MSKFKYETYECRNKMLKIFICEDDKEQREAIESFVKCTIVEERLHMEIAVVTDKPEDIIINIPKKNDIGIYFLDVNLKADIDSICLAAEII